jgi:hypothetical protein
MTALSSILPARRDPVNRDPKLTNRLSSGGRYPMMIALTDATEAAQAHPDRN